MSQPAGAMRVTFNVEDPDRARAIVEATAAMKKFGLTARDVGVETERTGRKQKSWTDQATADMKRLVLAGSPVMLMYQSIQRAVALLRSEYDAMVAKQDRAAQGMFTIEQQRNRALMQMQAGPGSPWSGMNEKETTQWLDTQRDATANKWGLKPSDFYRGMEAVQSSSFGFNRRQVEQAIALGAQMQQKTGEAFADTAATSFDIMRATGAKTPEEAQGMLMFGMKQSRIDELKLGAQTIPEAFTVGKLFGFTPKQTMGLFSTATLMARDVTGEETVTALASSMRSILTEPLFESKRMKEVKKAVPGRRGTVTTFEEETYWRTTPGSVTAAGTEMHPKVVENMVRTLQAGGIPSGAARAVIGRQDPEGIFAWVAQYFKTASKEGIAKFWEVVDSRGKFRPVMTAIYSGDPSATATRKQSEAEWEAVERSGGFGPYARERIGLTTAEVLGPRAKGEATAERLQQQNKVGQQIAESANFLKQTQSNLPGTWGLANWLREVHVRSSSTAEEAWGKTAKHINKLAEDIDYQDDASGRWLTRAIGDEPRKRPLSAKDAELLRTLREAERGAEGFGRPAAAPEQQTPSGAMGSVPTVSNLIQGMHGVMGELGSVIYGIKKKLTVAPMNVPYYPRRPFSSDAWDG